MKDDQPAIKVEWKTTIIPNSAQNRTEPLVASAKEIEAIIANPKSFEPNKPLESSELMPETLPEIEAAPRYNANVQYEAPVVTYSENDRLLIKAIQLAVANGWGDYHRFANDAVTVGMEGEAVIANMKKTNTEVQKVILNRGFNMALWGDSWKDHLKELAISAEPMKYLKEHLPDD